MVTVLSPDIVASPQVIMAIIALAISNVILNGYRDGQLSSFKVEGLSTLLFSITSILIIALSISYLISLLLWSFIEAFRNVSVESSILQPLVRFFSGNPLGLALIVVVLISVFYSIFINITETLILYLKPSRDLAMKALRLDPYMPIKPPLTSWRNAIITLAISPSVYALLLRTMEALGLTLQGGAQTSYIHLLAKWALATLVLILVWLILTRTLTRFDEVEPGAGGVVAGLTLIVLTYTLLLASRLWDPRVEGLNLARADQYLSTVVIEYYEVLFSIVEIVPMLIGLAP